MIIYFASGFLAAGVSWLINGMLIERFGNRAVIFFGPAVEELAKTGLAVLLNTSIIITHALFGTFEAAWELKLTRNGLRAAFYAQATHLFYGIISALAWHFLGFVPAVALAYILHMSWNYWIVHKTVSS